MPERRESDRRDGERVGGLAPIPPSAIPGSMVNGLSSGSAGAAAPPTDGRTAEARPLDTSGAAPGPVVPGLIDRPAAKAE
jgi:hypothetical protein